MSSFLRTKLHDKLNIPVDVTWNIHQHKILSGNNPKQFYFIFHNLISTYYCAYGKQKVRLNFLVLVLTSLKSFGPLPSMHLILFMYPSKIEYFPGLTFGRRWYYQLILRLNHFNSNSNKKNNAEHSPSKEISWENWSND